MGKRGPQKGHGGRPRKALNDKILEGNPGKRELKVLKVQTPTKDIDVVPMTLSVEGRNIYTRTVEYLKKLGCDEMVNPMLIETFAFNRQRWLEVESMNNNFEFAKISELYQNQMRKSWVEIFNIVNDNCTEQVNLDKEDDMHALLSL